MGTGNAANSASKSQGSKAGPTPSTIRIGRRYRPQRLDDKYDAIVIGSGIGGLTTAACLSRVGKKVLVLEQHYTAGGFTHSYARNGYEWDVGVHYIGDVGNPRTLTRRLFDFITDGELQWAPMSDNYDRFLHRGGALRRRRREETIHRRAQGNVFPHEHRAIDRYMSRLSAVNRAIQVISVEKLLPGTSRGTVQVHAQAGAALLHQPHHRRGHQRAHR